MERELSGNQVLPDESRHLLEQHRVLQYQQVRFENLRFLSTHRLAQPLLHGEDLPARLHQGRLEPILLPGQFRLEDARLRRVDTRAVQHHDLAAAHPLRHGDALQHFLAGFAPIQHARKGNRGSELGKGIYGKRFTGTAVGILCGLIEVGFQGKLGHRLMPPRHA